MRNERTTNEMLTRKDNFLLGSVSLVVCMIQCDAPVWRTFCTKINCVVVREWYLPDLSTDQDFRKIHHVKLHKYEYLYTI